MPKAEWGVKRMCPTTGKRFYDLNRTPIISPYTGEVVDIESLRRKGAGIFVAPEAKAARLIEEDIESEDLIEAEATEDADLGLSRRVDRRSGRRGLSPPARPGVPKGAGQGAENPRRAHAFALADRRGVH